MRDGAPGDKGPDDKAGGPAFPWQRFAVDGQWFPGITVRDYMAAHAMQGMLASMAGTITGEATLLVAPVAYAYADAMLRERAKS